MGLIVPCGPDWSYRVDNITGTPAALFGTEFDAGASNVKGSVVQVLSAIERDLEYLAISFSSLGASGAYAPALVDIMYDPAGGTDWQILIPDLLAGHTAPSSEMQTRWYHFPVWVPAGSALGVRGATSAGADDNGFVILTGMGGNRNPASWWCGQKVSAIGAISANSTGTYITSGAIGADGAWTNIGSPLLATAGAFQFASQGEGDSSFASITYRIEIGIDDRAFGPSLTVQTSTTEFLQNRSQAGVIYRSVTAGTQLQARATSSSGSPPNIDVAIYAVS